MFYIKQTTKEICEEAARLFVGRVLEKIAKKGVFYLSLSGGQTPKVLFEELVKDKWSRQIPWEKIVFFWGDERFVPADDPQSNQKMAREYLLDHIPAKQVYPVPVLDTAAASAEAYEKLLYTAFAGFPRFDLVLLGMGADGHTASLFPGTSALEETRRLVCPVRPAGESMERITLTYPVLNQAGEVWFFVTGKEKAFPVRQIFHEDANKEKLPVQRIHPASGKVIWFMDAQAAAFIQ